MKKKRVILAAVVVFCLVIAFFWWIERPILMQQLSTMVTTTLNERINGNLSFSSMDMSLTGNVIIHDPVIEDMQGRTIITGKDVTVRIDPLQAAKTAVVGGNAAACIESVVVESPVMNLQENKDGQWNVNSLIKPNSTKEDSGFRAAVHIQNGGINVVMADGMAVRADSCNGMIDFSKYPEMYGELSVVVDGKNITASGHYTSKRQYDVTLRGDAVKAKYLATFIPPTIQVNIQDGTVENIRARIAKSHNGSSVSGQADVRNGSATVNGYTIDSLSGHVDVTSDDVTLKHVVGNVNGQAVTVSGLIKTNTDSPVFQLDIDAPAVDVAAVVPNASVPFSGVVGVRGRVWGTIADLRAKGTVTIPDIDVQGVNVQHGTVDFSYADNTVYVESFTADIAGGSVSGKGSYSQNSGDYSMAARLESIRLSDIPQIPVSVIGTISGNAEIQGNINANTVFAKGHATAADLSYNGIEAESAQADFSYADGQLNLLGVEVNVQGGTIQANGSYNVNNGVSDISFSAHNLPLAVFSNYMAVPMNGTVSAAGRISGTEPVWDVTFNASSGSVKNVPFDTVAGTLRGNGYHIEIPSVKWTYVDGMQIAHGAVDLSNRTIQLSVDTQKMRLEKLLPFVGKKELPLTGWASNHVDVGGTLDNISASGSFHLTDGSAYGYLYKNISADYRLENGIVQLENGDIAAYDSHVKFYGSIGDTLAIHIESPDLDIARIMPRSKMQKSGIVDISAFIGGTPDNPTAVASVQSPRVVLNDMPITDFKGEVGYYDGIVRLSDLHFKQNGGMYEASGGWNPANDWVMIRASVISGDIESWLKILDLPVENVSGKIDGKITIDGTTHNPRGTIQGQINQTLLAGYAVDPTDVDVRFENGVITVNKFAINVDNGFLAAKGTYALHGPVKLQIGSRNFSSKILTSILGKKNIDVDTRIDCAADISGTGDHPNMDISVQLNGGTINGISFTNFYGMFNVRDRIIRINQAYISRNSYKASAYGSIPIGALTGDKSSNESMDVTLQLDNADLDILAFAIPSIKKGTGQLNGSVKLLGTLARPQLKGTIAVQNGTLQFRNLQYPLENIDATVVMDGTKATVNSSGSMDKKGRKHKGSYTLNGNICWNGWLITSYEGSLIMDRLGIDCNYFKGPVSGQLSIGKGDHFPLLRGNIQISDATINIPFVDVTSGQAPDLEMDVTVSLGKKVRLYNPMLYDLMAKGAASFRGTVAHPMPSGRFEAINGSIRYLDTRFNIVKGQADFSQLNSFLPYMNVEAHSRVGQYNVMLTLRGPADNMNLLLRSQPPLTRQQILSLITLRNGDKDNNSFSNSDVSGLIGTGVRMTLDSLGVTSSLERALSLDMLNITSGSLNANERLSNVNRNYYNIEMGKYLFNDFMVTAAFGLNHRDNRAGLRYDVTNHVSVNAWKSSDDSFVGGQYRYSFY